MPTANRSPGAGDQLSSTSWRPRIFQRAVSITHPEQRVHGSAARTGECRRGIAIYGLSAPEASAIYSSVVCSQRLSFAHSLPFAFLCVLLRSRTHALRPFARFFLFGGAQAANIARPYINSKRQYCSTMGRSSFIDMPRQGGYKRKKQLSLHISLLGYLYTHRTSPHRRRYLHIRRCNTQAPTHIQIRVSTPHVASTSARISQNMFSGPRSQLSVLPFPPLALNPGCGGRWCISSGL